MIEYQKLGQRLKEIRISKNISQSELSERAHLTQVQISKIETGKTRMMVGTFKRIVEALGVSADSVLMLEVPGDQAEKQSELESILEGCTTSEKDSILKVVREMKIAFMANKDN